MTYYALDAITLERRPVDVPSTAIPEAAKALTELGVSVSLSDDHLSALIRWGSKGCYDRAVLLAVEIRLSSNRLEQEQWLEMCHHLPSSAPLLV
ncbi:MAG: hypothetical protein HC924_14200 [Synechococcaceae cyanobacterium SM2_3_2]|nr:hypothetical protein [Synechococcaceae cyanobacterium SM2_3_2]